MSSVAKKTPLVKPPTKAAAPALKRKAPSAAPSPSAPPKELPSGLAFDDEEAEEAEAAQARADEGAAAAPMRAGGDVSTETDAEAAAGEARAKLMWQAKYKRPKKDTRVVKTGGGAKPTVTVEGIVLGTSTVSVSGRSGQPVPKLNVTIAITGLRANDACDLLRSGVDGIDFLLPTQVPKGASADVDDDPTAPPAGGKAKRAPPPPRQLNLQDSENHKTILLSHLPRASFYTTSDKNETKAGMELVVKGMPVSVTGVVAKLSDDGQQLWLNANGVSPLRDGIVPSRVAGELIKHFEQPKACEAAAVRLSMTMRGFFGMTYQPSYETQANWFRQQWVKARDGMAAACSARAMALRAEHGDQDQNAVVLDMHTTRLKGTNPADLAFGAPFLQPSMPSMPDKPLMSAPIVVRGCDPWMPQHAWLQALFDGAAARAKLPETFVVGEVLGSEYQGACLNVKLKLTFIGSKTAAAESLGKGEDPTLDSGDYACLGIKFNMRTLWQTHGLLVSPKAHAFCLDMFAYGDWFAVAGVTPREPSDTGVNCVFPQGEGIDMVPTLGRIGVLVSEAFVREHLAGGPGKDYTYEHDPELEYLKDKEGVPIAGGTALPLIKMMGYQEITGTSWKFEKARMPADAPVKEYRIWWEGAVELIAADPDLLSNKDAGVDAVTLAASEAGVEDTNAFLLTYAAVYVIARPTLA